jgi:hypothetical protein
MTAPETIILITTTATGVVAIINAIANGFRQKEVTDKLDEIHHLTNSTLSKALNEIIELKRVLRERRH